MGSNKVSLLSNPDVFRACSTDIMTCLAALCGHKYKGELPTDKSGAGWVSHLVGKAEELHLGYERDFYNAVRKLSTLPPGGASGRLSMDPMQQAVWDRTRNIYGHANGILGGNPDICMPPPSPRPSEAVEPMPVPARGKRAKVAEYAVVGGLVALGIILTVVTPGLPDEALVLAPLVGAL